MRVNRLHLLIIAAVIFIIYFPSFFFEFTFLDDNALILNNQEFLKNWWNIFTAFGREVFQVFGGGAGYYRPLLTASFIWDAQWGGANPFFYHLTNVVLHICASCLVYVVLSQFSTKNLTKVLFLSLMFAVHPIMTQAVSWIPGRNDSLLAIFILASFYFFLKTEKFVSRRTLWHLVFFAAALFTKETAIVFPGMLFLYSLYFSGASHPWAAVKKVPIKQLFASEVFLVVIYLLVKHAAIGDIALGMIPVELIKTTLFNSQAIFLYLGKIFVPFHLSVFPILEDANLLIGVVAGIAIAALTIFRCKFFNLRDKSVSAPCRLILFGGSWFLIFLVPSFIRPNQSIAPDFLEHRAYLSFFGILLMFLVLLPNRSRLINITLITVIILLSIVTFFHQFNFRNRLVFWQNAVLTSPHSAFAHKNMGAMFHLDENMEDAEKEYLIALRLNPQEPIVHNNLGLILVQKGKFSQAEEEYKKEIKINPTYDNVYFNYGLLVLKEERFEEAEKLWQQTIALNPGYADAWKNLIGLALKNNDQAKANIYLIQARKVGLNF